MHGSEDRKSRDPHVGMFNIKGKTQRSQIVAMYLSLVLSLAVSLIKLKWYYDLHVYNLNLNWLGIWEIRGLNYYPLSPNLQLNCKHRRICFAYIYTHTHIYTHTQIYIHAYTNAHIYIYIQIGHKVFKWNHFRRNTVLVVFSLLALSKLTTILMLLWKIPIIFMIMKTLNSSVG